VGDWVEISGLAGLGRLLELDDKRGRALVQMKDHMLTVPRERIARAPAPPPPPSSSLVRVQGRSAMQYEIDLHGQRVEEAIEMVDRALDQAVVNHLDKFKIIHGHGTGALRKAVRDLLARHPHVENFRFGEPHEGGLACTVAFLRRRN
jgi:DNA mismatch repair protein MutS2